MTETFSFDGLQSSRFYKHPLLLFNSDAKNEDAGFDLQITQIRCSSESSRNNFADSARGVLPTSDSFGGVQLNFPRNFSLFVPVSQNPVLTVDNQPGFKILTPSVTLSVPVIPPTPLRPVNRLPCDRMFTSKTGILTSPKYPRDYPSNLDCLYTLYPSGVDVCRVRLRFLNFDLERSHQCRNDYLLVQNTGEKLCGQQLHLQDRSECFG